MQRFSSTAFAVSCGALLLLFASHGDAQNESPQPLVEVNGRTITSADLQFFLLSRGVKTEPTAEVRRQLAEQLVDRELVRAFLAERKIEPNEELLDRRIADVRRQIAQTGEDPDAILKRIGYDDARLRTAVALPLAWQAHVRLVVTAAQLRDYFDKHRRELDGTELRASQIFLKLAADADPAEAEQKLEDLRQQIVDEKITFAEAAKENSQAPSAAQGGDLGFFPYRGKMPPDIADAAFALKPGEVSQPFRTQFGLHLLTVTEVRPGQFSLEDVRPAVYSRLSDELWKESVAELRKDATIEWRTD